MYTRVSNYKLNKTGINAFLRVIPPAKDDNFALLFLSNELMRAKAATMTEYR